MDKNIVLSCVSVAIAFICVGISFIGCTWLGSIGKNPEASSKLQTPAVILLGFLEVPLLILIVTVYTGINA